MALSHALTVCPDGPQHRTKNNTTCKPDDEALHKQELPVFFTLRGDICSTDEDDRGAE
jgi:hypothetical protein